jgi:hypothetical protein
MHEDYKKNLSSYIEGSPPKEVERVGSPSKKGAVR